MVVLGLTALMPSNEGMRADGPRSHTVHFSTQFLQKHLLDAFREGVTLLAFKSAVREDPVLQLYEKTESAVMHWEGDRGRNSLETRCS